MLIEASAMKIRQNFGELINQVQYCNASIEVTKNSEPVAAIISIDLFDKIKLMEKEFNRLSKEIAKSFKDEDYKTMQSTIDESVKKIRKKSK